MVKVVCSEVFECKGDLETFIEQKISNKEIIGVKTEKNNNNIIVKYIRTYKTIIDVPQSLITLCDLCGFKGVFDLIVEETIIKNDTNIVCTIVSPKGIKDYFDFREETVFTIVGKDSVTCKFTSSGETLSLAVPFTHVIKDTYKKARISKMKIELEASVKNEQNWAMDEDFIDQ